MFYKIVNNIVIFIILIHLEFVSRVLVKMARIFYFIFFVCILFGFAYSESPTPRCQDPNKIYECRSDWDTGTCADRYKSPPFAPTPQDVCRCYCKRGSYEDKCGKCVAFDDCD
ncbi:uncharacterized protein LOC133523696 [Cydia pomonella]|uniref:uncharacterized protein LOC133523696 n=1 Tax=Cydia pomonella TaxID=82600 RepID=UPI002ADE85FA|nr:uncharacterized protein LOC133523696 [Cydia pomonella]